MKEIIEILEKAIVQGLTINELLKETKKEFQKKQEHYKRLMTEIENKRPVLYKGKEYFITYLDECDDIVNLQGRYIQDDIGIVDIHMYVNPLEIEIIK